MKYIHWTLLSVALGSILAGIIVQISGYYIELIPKLYGVGTVLLFLVWMPFFLIWRSFKTKLFDAIMPKEDEEKNPTE